MPGEPIQQTVATEVIIDGVRRLSFAGCNYLGLAHHPRVLDAARSAIGRMGMSTSASRETSGNSPEHAGLEAEIAEFIGRGAGSGLLLPDGYTANLAASQALSRTHRFAVLDERAHQSLFDSVRAAGFVVRTYSHLDAGSLADRLAGLAGPAVVMTDGVFTADGAVAPLAGLDGALRGGDWLLVDDCHGFCVMGAGGRGTCDEAGVWGDRVLVTTTLAKGLGCGGGVVIGPAGFIEEMRRVSTAYICTTPVSPVVAAAAREALRVVIAEPRRVRRLREHSGMLRGVCGRLFGGDHASPTPIVGFVPGEGVPQEGLARRLLDLGVYVPLMRYPGGATEWYFRASVTSEHDESQIGRLGEALAAALSGVAACRA